MADLKRSLKCIQFTLKLLGHVLSCVSLLEKCMITGKVPVSC